jgi:hypothetical protein
VVVVVVVVVVAAAVAAVGSDKRCVRRRLLSMGRRYYRIGNFHNLLAAVLTVPAGFARTE